VWILIVVCLIRQGLTPLAEGGKAIACHLFGGASRVTPHLTNSCNDFLGKMWNYFQVNGNKDKGYII